MSQLIFCFAILANAFQTHPDSLKADLKAAPSALERGVAYVKLAQYYERHDLDIMEAYLDSAAAVLDYSSRPEKRVKLNFMRAALLERRGHLDSAKVVFERLIREQEEQGIPDTLIATSSNYKLGNILRRTGQSDQAIIHILRSKDLDLAVGDSIGAASSDILLGIIHKNNKQYEKAIDYYRQAYRVYQGIPNYDNMATCILNIANVLGRQDKFLEAESYYREALGLADSVPNSASLLAFVYANLANLNSQQKKYKEALEYSEKAYDLRKDRAGAEEKLQALTGMATNLKGLKRLPEALQKLEEANALIERHPEFLEAQLPVRQLQFQIQKDRGNFALALARLEEYAEIRDSFNTLEIEKQALELNTKYETEQKETEIKLLNSEKELAKSELRTAQQRTIGLSIAALVFGGLLLLVFRLLRKTRLQNMVISQALEQKEILIREIHHRVKNNLQFISSLLGLQTEHVVDSVALDALQEGQDRVQSMALIHQDLYREDNLTGVDVRGYFVKLIRGLFDSYNIRGDQIGLDLEVSDLNLDVDTVVPVGLVANELVSNALKYAFPDGRRGRILVKLSEQSGRLLLSVIDDGVGMDSETKESLGSSFGYRLIHVLQTQLDAELVVKSIPGTQVDVSIGKYSMAKKSISLS